MVEIRNVSRLLEAVCELPLTPYKGRGLPYSIDSQSTLAVECDTNNYWLRWLPITAPRHISIYRLIRHLCFFYLWFLIDMTCNPEFRCCKTARSASRYNYPFVLDWIHHACPDLDHRSIEYYECRWCFRRWLRDIYNEPRFQTLRISLLYCVYVGALTKESGVWTRITLANDACRLDTECA